MSKFFNTGMSQQQFLNEYWQKKPLLIRQAFVDFESPISPNDLAGLACEPDIESRLIEEHGQDSPWQVTHGPLSEDVFSRLPASHWTMLVQDVDKHLPELQSLLDPFRFIPDWRRDDLMISYAVEQGTVGPHTDGYDVFLLQAMGTRRWQIGEQALIDPQLIEGLDLQILSKFNPAQQWELQPGDILYLPPHFAHHGVALNDCMTFSIGFRAPSATDMLDAVINGLLEHELGKERYSDPDLTVLSQSSKIDQQAVTRLKQLLHKSIDKAEPILAQTLGKFVTETKSSLAILAEEKLTSMPTGSELEHHFEQNEVLQRNHYYRFAWTTHLTQGYLFMAGEMYAVDGEATIKNLPYLADMNELTVTNWHHIKQDEQLVTLLCQLIAEGGWYWSNSV